VRGLNLFAGAALYMAPKKMLPEKVKTGLIAPYSCPENRIATYTFVQDIPLDASHPSFELVKWADDNLYLLSEKPMQILWGEHDFVFDTDYFNEWVRRFPDREKHFFRWQGIICLRMNLKKLRA
jgi:haloalkane dehalogenase